jgi:hypothetical protein
MVDKDTGGLARVNVVISAEKPEEDPLRVLTVWTCAPYWVFTVKLVKVAEEATVVEDAGIANIPAEASCTTYSTLDPQTGAHVTVTL